MMGLKDYKAACEFFVASNATCGDHHVTWHNIGMCHFYLDQAPAAIAGFERALELKPDYRCALLGRCWGPRLCAAAG